MKKKVLSFAMMFLMAFMPMSIFAFSGSGTSSSPYLIQNANDWNTFAANVTNGNTYSGVYFKLTSDISVTTWAGNDTNPFSGIFDGNNKTITVNYTATGNKCAPFIRTRNVEIHNLKVTGSITTAYVHAAGFVAYVDANCLITDCVSDVTINSTYSGERGVHGGFVGEVDSDSYGNLTIRNSVFTGRLLGPSTIRCGGFVGWSQGNYASWAAVGHALTKCENCIFAPKEITMGVGTAQANYNTPSATFVRGFPSSGSSNPNTTDITITNCYYTQTFGTVQGSQIYAISSGQNVTVNFHGSVNNTTGVIVESNGLSCDGSVYVTNGTQTLSLDLNYTGSMVLDGYTASAGTLTGSSNPYSLAINNENVTISAIAHPDSGEIYEEGLHTYATYGVGDEVEELIDVLYIQRPNGAWMEPYHFQLYNDGTENVEVVLIDFLHNNGYFSMDEETTEYPFDVPAIGLPGVDLYINTNIDWADTETINSLLAVNTTERSTHLYEIIAEPYTPYCPDVFEKAYNIGVLATGTTWSHTASWMWNQANPGVAYDLHDNYTLPFPEIPEGYDAVMKFTANHDIMLNAYVNDGENGKVALYRSDFNGEAGPMADNNYTGRPMSNVPGGGGDQPAYEAQIGNGTTQSGYLPMYYLYDNSLSTQIFRADELIEAGANTAPMSSISWYSESTYNYNIQNVSIWMANVSDNTVSANTPLGSSMSLVYTGNHQEVVGWNEFVFNNDVFSWDGQSNLLVMVQMNNGDWGSAIQWFNHTASFQSSGYAYRDSTPYNAATESYTLSSYNMTSSRANTVFKSNGGRFAISDQDTYPDGYSAGPVIENLNVLAGTYYLVASSTDPDFEVVINAEELPCPIAAVTNVYPEDNAHGISPTNLTLTWTLDDYCNEWRIVFGSTYYPEDEPNHPATYISEWSADLAESLRITDYVQLWNNTNYFWRIEQRSNPGTQWECVTSGPVFGFTTTLNAPTNLQANGAGDANIFETEQDVTLTWTAIQDRTYRRYRIYWNGDLYYETPFNQVVTSYTIPNSEFHYNMGSIHTPELFNVTAVYDEGESPMSNTVSVNVSGYGSISGTVYEQDETTPIGGVTVFIQGTNEFGGPETYTFTTNEHGYYEGEVHVGEYHSAIASMEGYQSASTVHELPFDVIYDEETDHVDFILDEVFYAPAHVCAETVFVPAAEGDSLVHVWWDFDFYTALIEDFEDFENTPFDWTTTSAYPWTITNYNPYEGTYCLKSGGAGVNNVVSDLSVTVDIPNDGIMSFYVKASCENNWDFGYFYIDGEQRGSYTGAGNWGEKQFAITEGTHTFRWSYQKDGSVNSNDDCIYLDYIQFNRLPEPPVAGNSYDFDNGTQGWTDIDADGDGYSWMLATEVMGEGYGNNASTDCMISQSYNNSVGILYPDNYLVSPQVQLGGILKFYACAQDASYAAEHFGVAVSTTNGTSASAFTTIQEWTMSAKSGGEAKPVYRNTRSGRAQGNWYEYTVDLSAYAGQTGYVAIRHFNCSDMFYLDVDDILIGDASKGKAMEETRSLHHYNIYRTDCYNDGPYNSDNTVFLASVWRPDTSYVDVQWPEVPVGVYKYGVSAVYQGNQADNPNNPRTDYPFEDRESEIVWSNQCDCGMGCIDKDMYLNNEVTVNVVLNSADSPEGVRVDFLNLNEGEQYSHPQAGVTLDQTGYYEFPRFRKGDYLVTVSMPGYYTLEVEESIWEPRNLRYVLTEIICKVQNLYVSRTGWAMWDPQTPCPGGVIPGPDDPTGDNTSFTESFEGGLNGWNVLTVNADGGEWLHSDNNPSAYDYTTLAHGGTGFAMCYSFVDYVGSFDTDSYLYTPQKYDIVNGSTLTFWADNANDSYPESFSVCVSTADSPTASSFTQVWSGAAKGEGNAKSNNRHEANRYENWRLHSVDLSAYAGQSVWIAFHDVNYDQYEVWIDDVTLTAGRAATAERHLEGYKIMCTSIDGEPIFNHNTVAEQPFCQLATDQLVEGEHYICKVAAIYSTGMSEYESVTWQYESCEHYAGTVNGVTAEGNTITWDYPGGGVGPTPPPAGETSFNFGFENGFEGWTTIDNDGDGLTWVNSANSTTASGYDYTGLAHGGDYFVYSQSYIDYDGAYNADNYLITPQKYTIVNGSTLSLFADNANDSYPDHFEVCVATVDNPTANDFTMVWSHSGAKAGEKAAVRNNGERYQNWRSHSIDLSAYAGQNVWIALHHQDYDEYEIWIDDVVLTPGAKAAKAVPAGLISMAGVSHNEAPANYDRDGWLTYDNTGAYYNALGLNDGGEFSWGDMFPASMLTAYAGQNLTKVSMYMLAGDYCTGTLDFYQGGTTEPGTLISSQAFTTPSGAGEYIDVELTTPVAIDATQNLWVVVTATGYASHPAAMTNFQGDTNGSWIYLEGYGWMLLDDVGYPGTWMLKAYAEEGTTPVPPTPTPAEGILGAMIFVDGEWEAFVPVPTNTYTYEGDGQEICVRIVYDGTAQTPDNNYYYAMSCEECVGGIEPQPECEAGAPIYAEVNGADDQVHIYWGEQPEPPTPGEGDTFMYDFENGSIDGLTLIDNDGDGYNWLVNTSFGGHNGSTGIIYSQSYDNNYGALTPDNYIVFPQSNITNGSTFSFWACGQDASWASEHFGVAVSTTGTNASDFTTIQEWTMTAKGTKAVRDGRDQGNWYQYSVDLSDYAGQQVYIAIRHFNCTDMFYLDVDDVELSIAAKGNRDGIIGYNIYRSTDNVDYALIATVDGDVTEYFDAPGAGTYYYQVTALYDGCESDPAVSGENPNVNYVMVGVTGVGENSFEVNLFPNPTKGNVTIQAVNMHRITVVSVLGQVVFDTELDQDEYILNMAKFNTGVYMVRVYTEDGVTVKRVTVLH